MAATIVLADDDDDLRAMYGAFLRASGFEVHEAADGVLALEQVRSRRPDLLVLDLWMPRLNGFEVLDGLRHDAAAAGLRVLMLSAQGDSDSRLESFGAGAFDYLTKGLALDELLAHVRRALDAPEGVASAAP